MKKYLQGGLGLLIVITLLIGAMPGGVKAEDEKNSDESAILQTSNLDASREYWYEEVAGGVVITSYTGKGGDVVIPATLDGKKVVEIGQNSFTGNYYSISSVSIPNGVTTIGKYAFYGCIYLKSVSIPNSVTTIRELAFKECISLNTLSLPYGLKTIEAAAFSTCGIEVLTLPNSLTAIDDSAFENCIFLTSVTIPESITYISGSAFLKCVALASVTIPDSVTAIGPFAFFSCSGLKEITIPDSVSVIDHDAFNKCSGLTSITLPSSVVNLESSAFKDCTSLTSVSLPNSLDLIKYSTFEGCTSLKEITIPHSVTYLGNSAFENCAALTSITIPNGQTALGYSVFDGCSGLTIYGIKGSLAEGYANQHTIPFVAINHPLTSIAVTSPPDKTVYKVGESLDLTGLVVTATYDDGTQTPVAVTAANISGFNSSALATGQQITVTVSGKTATFTVDIVGKLLSNIAITTPPDKTTYQVGESLDLTGLVVTATYDDGTQAPVTAVKISGFNSSTPVTGQLITITVNGKTASFLVDIVKNDISGLGIYYRTHVQNIGWQEQKGNGELSGTTGMGYRLEAIQITGWDSVNQQEVDIYYQTHVQNIGWQDWRHNKDISGTSGLGLRLEAIRILLPDSVAYDYDVYYQVHAQNFGWLDWAKNGESSGTAGFGYRLEAIRIVLLPKGSPAPGAADRPFIQN